MSEILGEQHIHVVLVPGSNCTDKLRPISIKQLLDDPFK